MGQMGKAHDIIVKHYANPKNAFFIDGEIKEIYVETSFRDMPIFKSRNRKTPDLVYDTDVFVYIAEVKPTNTLVALNSGSYQLMKYMKIAKKEYDDVKAVLIAGDDVIIR